MAIQTIIVAVAPLLSFHSHAKVAQSRNEAKTSANDLLREETKKNNEKVWTKQKNKAEAKHTKKTE